MMSTDHTDHHAVNFFSVASSDDPMELVSDIDRRLNADEDNDIDLDIDGDQENALEDDSMVEDTFPFTEQEGHGYHDIQPANDDEMVDQAATPQQDEDEDSISINDEDLDDVQDFIEAAQSTENTLEEDLTHLRERPFEHSAPNTDLIAAAIEEDTGDTGSSEVADHQEEGFSGFDPENRTFPLQTKSEALDQGDKELFHPAPESSSVTTNEYRGEEPEGLRNVSSEEQGLTIDLQQPVTAPGLSDAHSNQGIPSELNEHLHPIIVLYQETEMSLFPPLDQDQQSQTYLLEDEALASKSISQFLASCRAVLAESIGEEDELEIRFEDLGLAIYEGAVESNTTSLTQIIDTYLQLQRLDGIEGFDPIYMTLCTRIKFSHRLALLINAAAEGKGLSQLSFRDSFQESNETSDILRAGFQDGTETWPTDESYGVVNSDQEEDLWENGGSQGNPPTHSNANQNEEALGLGVFSAQKDDSLRYQTEGDQSPTTTPVKNGNHSNNVVRSPGATQEVLPSSNEQVQCESQAIQADHDIETVVEPYTERADLIEYNERGEDPDQEVSSISSTIQGDGSQLIGIVPGLQDEQAQERLAFSPIATTEEVKQDRKDDREEPDSTLSKAEDELDTEIPNYIEFDDFEDTRGDDFEAEQLATAEKAEFEVQGLPRSEAQLLDEEQKLYPDELGHEDNANKGELLQESDRNPLRQETHKLLNEETNQSLGEDILSGADNVSASDTPDDQETLDRKYDAAAESEHQKEEVTTTVTETGGQRGEKERMSTEFVSPQSEDEISYEDDEASRSIEDVTTNTTDNTALSLPTQNTSVKRRRSSSEVHTSESEPQDAKRSRSD